uniref:Protein FAR1-RELATED SEQUENCE n=3 Tax=Aegilops tauschii subsp. strangulata TaxID=200361 RepID=A0A453JS61_AEGTS
MYLLGKFRLRPGSAPPDRTPCPSRMSALEQSICKYAEEPTKSVVRPALGLTFDSLGEAYDYYSLHIWEIGFGVRYGKSRLNAERTMCMHEIVCGCSVSTEF